MLLSILAVLVVLSPIVLVHEFGHFLACRLTGIRVQEFSFGFGKILWHKKHGDTDYQIRAIPFGGFVEPAGPMFHPQDAQEPPKPYEFAAKPWYSKFFMVVNGAVFNYLLAAVIFSVLAFWQGRPEKDLAKMPAVVGQIVQGYPAEQVDLQPGDEIISVNNTPVISWQNFSDAVSRRTGDLDLTYKRGENTLQLTVPDSYFKKEAPHTLGIVVQGVWNPVPWWKAVGYGIYDCYYWTKLSFTSIGKSLSNKKAPELAGPIGIVNIIHQAAHSNLVNFIFLIALLSVAVGMFNLFPIPILDGGYALVFLWEGLTKKLPTEKMLTHAANVGIGILVLLVGYASYSDIKRIFFKPKPAVVQPAEKTTAVEEPHVQN